MDLVEDKNNSQIFKDLTICTSGFTTIQKEEIKRLVELNGGVYNSCFNINLTTHLVINVAKGEKYKSARHYNVPIVNLRWVLDSCSASHCLSIKDYSIDVIANDKLIMSQSQIQAHSIPIRDTQEYNLLKDNQSNEKLKSIVLESKTSLFEGKKFSVYNLEVEEKIELVNLIVENGGVLIENNSTNIEIDYLVTPLVITKQLNDHTIKHLVTSFWLNKCIESNKLIHFDNCFLYQSIPIMNNNFPLKDCVITISGYTGYEKDSIDSLCKLAGAHTQYSFSNICSKDGIRLNTHLICKVAEGPKYKASIKWNLPAVRVEWLIQSLISGTKADEAQYLIEIENFNTNELLESLSKIRKSLFSKSQVKLNDQTNHQLDADNEEKSYLLIDDAYNEKTKREVYEASKLASPQPISSQSLPKTPNIPTLNDISSPDYKSFRFTVDWDLVEGIDKQMSIFEDRPMTPYQELFEKAIHNWGNATRTGTFYVNTESP